MPWTCCDQQLNDDLTTCPKCGQGKAKWTLRLQKTRVFQVGGRHWVEIELLDADGHPVANEPYVLQTPKGKLRNGNLDEKGQAREERLTKGLCKVWFPERDWVEPPPWIPIERLPLAWIEVELLAHDDAPVAGEDYKITDCEDGVHEGELDSQGRVRLEGLPHGPCTVEFPDRDQTWFMETELDGMDPLAQLDWVEVELLDADGNGVGQEPYKVTLPDETVREGLLETSGKVRLERVPPGTCKVEFPERDQTWFQDVSGPAQKELQRLAWVEVELLDADGAPVAGEPYALTDPEGTKHEGKLDARGRARIERIPAGTCTVEFTERDQSHFLGAEADGPWQGPEPGGQEWLEVELLDAGGGPLAGEPYKVTLPDGEEVEGKLDVQGKLRLERIPAGSCKVEFPERDESWFTGAPAAPQGESKPRPTQLTWVEVELLDGRGDPLGNEPFVLTLPDGSEREGRLDGRGRVREQVPVGTCKVAFPERDAADFAS